ncbi:MAG: aminotransferase class V-fold PLP-dependent enzyme [Chloroflexi bacterium]|nr:aminotransferase class V-fold PLP-dependent enzyme [Chloroflexota bacterium]
MQAVINARTSGWSAKTRAYNTNGLAIDEIRQRVVGLDVKVPVLDGSRRPYVNFDNAATTPAFWDVIETLDLFLPWYSSVHRGSGFKSQISTRAYDDARAIVGRFFGADLASQVVIFGKNSSEVINKAARRIPIAPDDVVLVSLMEHHSNDLPWRAQAKTLHVEVKQDGQLDLDDLRRKFEEHRGHVKLLAITGASNVTGYITPIHELAELAHRHGAQILVDAAQLAPHRAITMLPPHDPGHIDFLAASAHKMYAPFGAGVLIGPRETFAKGAPDYSGGGTVEIVTEDDVYWTSPPERDEAGSPNLLGAVALAAACKALHEIGMERLAQHEADLTRYALTELSKIEGMEIYGDPDPARAESRLGVIPFNVKGLSHYLVAAVLGAEYAIGVRNGCFCAHPYVLRLLDIAEPIAWSWRKQVVAGVRAHLPGLIRVSFGCYNSHEEVDLLMSALSNIAAGEIAGDYEQDRATGTFRERTFQPEMDAYFKL